jgi:MFS family permease
MAYLGTFGGPRSERRFSETAEVSLWSPLRQAAFVGLFLAAFTSNIGTWIQNVAAAWLMTSLAPNPVMVGLVQTLSGLPVFLLIIPAGALADLVDRRRLLLFAQGWMFVAVALLGWLTVEGAMTPWVLLFLTFVVGIGAALNGPAWQTSLPEQVPRDELTASIALNGIQFNLARAIGPALGGVLVAAIGVGSAFLINAASFLVVLEVLYRWRREPTKSTLPAERLVGAIKAGIRYTRYSRPLSAVLVRAGAFVVGASAVPALLPLYARNELGAGATGYGVLLGFFGAGGVIGGLLMPQVRRHMSRDQTLSGSAIIYAAATAVLAAVNVAWAAYAVMCLAGLAWVLGMTSLNVTAQVVVPQWVKARALASYQLVVQGSIAIGGLLWGGAASHSSIPLALDLAAVLLVVGLVVGLRYHLSESETSVSEPLSLMPLPEVTSEIKLDAGPVMVSVEYEIDPGTATDFRHAMNALRTIRFRDGAVFWGLFSDAAKPSRYVEYFMVESWAEHLRQHSRVTHEDAPALERARRFHIRPTPPVVSHQVASTGTSGT